MLERLKLAWRVLTGSLTYAVTYDNANFPDHEDGFDQFYGWFDTPAEARQVFAEAFGEDPLVTDPRLVLVLGDL